jgi:hypothetical protein
MRPRIGPFVRPIPPGPICQSCGMPMSSDERGGGTEADGVTRSIEYCSLCYLDGKFTEPDLTVDEMIAKTQGRLQALGMAEPVIERNLWAIYGLDRWRD